MSFYLKSGYPAFAGPIRLIPQASCCTFSVSFPLKRLKKSLSTSLASYSKKSGVPSPKDDCKITKNFRIDKKRTFSCAKRSVFRAVKCFRLSVHVLLFLCFKGIIRTQNNTAKLQFIFELTKKNSRSACSSALSRAVTHII